MPDVLPQSRAALSPVFGGILVVSARSRLDIVRIPNEPCSRMTPFLIRHFQ